MIPRLVDPTIRPSRTEWPERSAPWSADLFLGRPPFRKLVVMVDAELAEIPFAIDSPHTRGLLFDLLRHPFLKVYRFADGGPPNDVDPDPSVPEEARADCFPGWVVIKEGAPEPRGSQVVFSPEPGSYALGGVMGNLVDVATADFRTSAYSELSPTEATQKRAADALAYQVATQVLRADLYITERPYLSAASWLHRDVTITDVRGGLAFIGFYLRSQDEYPVSDFFRFNRGLYSWVGTRELLPDGWRWFSACVQHSQGSQDDGLLVLGGSVFQRFQRALDARDMIHLALNKRQNNDTQQDALSQLDVVLLLLMAALDVTARVAHRVLGLTSGEHDAGWQRARWAAQVRAVAPDLMAAVSFPPANHILSILRLLRNTVHGAALQGMAVVQAGSTTNRSAAGRQGAGAARRNESHGWHEQLGSQSDHAGAFSSRPRVTG